MGAWKSCGPIDASSMGRTASKVEDLESALGRLASFETGCFQAFDLLPDSGSGNPSRRQSQRFFSWVAKDFTRRGDWKLAWTMWASRKDH